MKSIYEYLDDDVELLPNHAILPKISGTPSNWNYIFYKANDEDNQYVAIIKKSVLKNRDVLSDLDGILFRDEKDNFCNLGEYIRESRCSSADYNEVVKSRELTHVLIIKRPSEMVTISYLNDKNVKGLLKFGMDENEDPEYFKLVPFKEFTYYSHDEGSFIVNTY